MMNKENCIDEIRLQAYADGQISEAEWIEVESHLQGCRQCTDHLATIHSMIRLVENLPPVEPPQNFVQSVMVRLPADLYAPEHVTLFQWFLRYKMRIAFATVGVVVMLIMTALSIVAWGNLLTAAILTGQELWSDVTTLVSWGRTIFNVFRTFPNIVAISMGISFLIFGWGFLRLMAATPYSITAQHTEQGDH